MDKSGFAMLALPDIYLDETKFDQISRSLSCHWFNFQIFSERMVLSIR